MNMCSQITLIKVHELNGNIEQHYCEGAEDG